MDRRHFMKSASAASGLLATSPLELKGATDAGKKRVSDRVMPGKTGIKSLDQFLDLETSVSELQ